MNREGHAIRLLARLDEACARALELGPDRIRPCRQLRAGDAHAHPHLAVRLVQPVSIAPHDWQRESHRAGEPTRRALH